MHHRQQFDWKSPPYEYEFEKLPIDLISGDHKIRQQLEMLEPIEEMESAWQEDISHFKALSQKFHLYS